MQMILDYYQQNDNIRYLMVGDGHIRFENGNEVDLCYGGDIRLTINDITMKYSASSTESNVLSNNCKCICNEVDNYILSGLCYKKYVQIQIQTLDSIYVLIKNGNELSLTCINETEVNLIDISADTVKISRLV